MVAIGGCDYCGEFCAQLGLNQPFELDNGWVPPSQIERHNDLVARRLECAPFDGWELGPTDHVGPWHRRDGTPYENCPNCFTRSAIDYGEWDARLDHTECLDCWSEVAGASVLRGRLRRGSKWEALDTSGRHSRDYMLATEPADRRRFEAAFRAYLKTRGLKLRWVDSPLGVAEALFEVVGQTKLEAAASDGWRWSVWARQRRREDETEVADRDVDPTTSTIARALATVIAGEALWATDVTSVADLIEDAGQFDPQAASLGDDTGAYPDRPYTDLLVEFARSAGPVAVLASEIVVSERPLHIKLDDAGRLHCEDGPAIAYPDGLQAWAWHGVPVESWIIEAPTRIDVEKIDGEDNAEVRRVLIERFGAERLVRKGNAQLVQEDETGRLWRRRLSWERGTREEPVVMVEVVNSTPEPDGSRKTYWLRVPPDTRSAREAVAWTFGMGTGEYEPATET